MSEGTSQNSSSNLWWNMFEDKTAGHKPNAENDQKKVAQEGAESASSARSSLLFQESGRVSCSSEDMDDEHDDVDSEAASTTTDTSSIAARRGRNSGKRLGGRGGTLTALSGATLLLEAETDGDETESIATDMDGKVSSSQLNNGSVWSITNEQRSYYLREFAKLQPKRSGVIPGLLAKQYFLRSELPNSVLAEIWGMSDLDADGALNLTEFW